MSTIQPAPDSAHGSSSPTAPAPGQTSANRPSQKPGKVPSNEEPELSYEDDLPTPDRQEP